jgi:UDP-N-acetylmuramate:L-alanyl-gamma-D-glutamyl-meso-diaminopimelate ligase
MHVHILGICGTFMGGIAAIARAAGHRVTGSDRNVYPPMSTQLEALGIVVQQGFEADQLDPLPDIVVVGNVMTRGQPVIEAMLEQGVPYASGPEWLSREVLNDRWVLAVAGTHGKTTTTSLLTWILEHAGLAPGFLIGGVPANFDTSARLGGEPFFVIEADEYDTAFFDKRAKFVHYRPRTVILNNLEYDHADIYPTSSPSKGNFTIWFESSPEAAGSSGMRRMRAWSRRWQWGAGPHARGFLGPTWEHQMRSGQPGSRAAWTTTLNSRFWKEGSHAVRCIGK